MFLPDDCFILVKLSLERIRLLRLEVGFFFLAPNQNMLLKGSRGCPNPFTEIRTKGKNVKLMKGEIK